MAIKSTFEHNTGSSWREELVGERVAFLNGKARLWLYEL